MRYSSVTLATSFIIVQCFFVQISVASRSPGEISPQRIEIKIGGSANITCSMNLQMFAGKDSSSLYFVEEESRMEVPKQDVVIVNTTSIVYMMRNARPQIKEYVCKSGLNAIGVTKVYVGTKPTDIDDFQCRGYDFTYMVCKFSIPSNMILTQYNLSYTAQSPFRILILHKNGIRAYRTIYSQNYLQMCELEIQDQHGICNLTLERSNYRPNYEFYNFTLIGHNPLGTHRQSFWINHYESVIPPRPEYVFDQLSDNSVVLAWQLVKYSYYNSRGLQYEIRILPEDFEWVDHSNYEIRNNKSEYKLKLLNLPYAYYWYTVSARMKIKSAREDDTMWSESYLQRFQTKPRLPESPPMLDVGSFYIDSSETHLRIYWQQLPAFHENGPNFKYIITSVKRNGEEINILPLHIDRISAILTWEKSHHYEITIKSHNDVGESVESRKIIVHPMRRNHEDRAPKWIRNVYHALNHTYTLSWSPPVASKNLVDYTVFWCQSKRATLNECRGTIQFQHINKNTTKFTTAPQRQEHALNFAVSANYKDYNSGMRWTMCTADVTSDLVKLEPEITPISARSIKIQWSPDRVCTSLLEGYNLTYCKVDSNLNVSADAVKCVEKNITITIEKTAKKYLLTNLSPFSSYKIEVNMFSKLKRGKISDPLVVKTIEEAPSPPRNLKYSNITSNSAWISWNAPTQMNGKLRHYVIIQNNEQHIVNCTTTDGNICNNDTDKELSYKLENLSSYTNYKVYIIAHTVEDSFPSNDIHFKTLIGIPSNPRHMVPLDSNHTIMHWSPPVVPSGRVEYYEVAVIVWYRDQIQRQRISGVVDAISCAVNVPLCPDTDYKHTLQVRAINVAERKNEVDHHVFASNFTEEDFDDIYSYGNDDLKCIGTTFTDDEQTAIVQRYRNTKKYKQYKSVWEKGPTYGCAATTKLSRITSIALLVFVISLSVMAAFYFARNKYNKMANIDCALPPGLDAMPYPIKGGVENTVVDKEDEELHRSKESLYNNEKHHLLSSICNDSGYLCGRSSSGLNNSGPCSIGKSSGYVGSERSDDYSQTMRHPTKTMPIDSSYMVMEVLKPKADADNVVSRPKNPIPAEDNGYIKPGVANSFLSLKPTTLPIIPSNNGYIKPNKLFHWQPQSGGHRKSIPHESDAIAVSSSGYVQPQMLIKSTVQPTADGYTSLDALGKATLGVSMQTQSSSPHIFGGHSSPAPISGYVTQKELSAFGQQRMS